MPMKKPLAFDRVKITASMQQLAIVGCLMMSSCVFGMAPTAQPATQELMKKQPNSTPATPTTAALKSGPTKANMRDNSSSLSEAVIMDIRMNRQHQQELLINGLWCTIDPKQTFIFANGQRATVANLFKGRRIRFSLVKPVVKRAEKTAAVPVNSMPSGAFLRLIYAL